MVAGLCDDADCWESELVRKNELMLEEELVARDEEELLTVEEDCFVALGRGSSCPSVLNMTNGYGSSEVVKLVVQQSSRCSVGPAQHQLLPLGSQRLTLVLPSN